LIYITVPHKLVVTNCITKVYNCITEVNKEKKDNKNIKNRDILVMWFTKRYKLMHVNK